MKLLNYDKVLCLSPHPDDIEYGVLGTIMKYKDTKFEIVVLSQGGDFDESTAEERQEAIEEFLDYALSKEAVRVVSMKQVLDWVRNPSPL